MDTNKMTLGYSVTLFLVIDKILYVGGSNVESPVERPLPFNVKYKLQRASNVLLKDYAHYEQFRTDLIRNIGVETNGMISVPEEKMEEFKASLSTMLTTEVKHSFKKLRPYEVEEITDGVEISCEEMNLFISYLVEDEDFIKDITTPFGETATEAPKEEVSEGSAVKMEIPQVMEDTPTEG